MKLRILPGILILLLMPAYYIYLTAPGIGTFHDDGIYLVSAQSLAQGTGYRIASLPSRLPQTKYPILYPALLSGVIKIFPSFPQDLPALKTLSLLFTILWCILTVRLLRELGSPQWTWWILFFTLAAPWVIFVSSMTLPDTLFAFLSTLAVLLLLKATARTDRSHIRSAAFAGIICGFAFLARSAGAPLIAAGAFVLVYRKMYGNAIAFLALSVLVSLPWIYWQATQPGPTDAVQIYYSKLNYQEGNIFGHYAFPQIFKIVLQNVAFLLSCFGESLGGGALGVMGGIVLWIPLIGGLIESFRNGLTVVNTWILLYFAMLLCWICPHSRYEMPIYPLLLLLIANGLQGAAYMISSPDLRRLVTATLVALATVRAGLSVWDISKETLRKGVAATNPVVASQDWAQMASLSAWLRNNTPKDAILTAELDPSFYLLTQRKTVVPYRHETYKWVYEDSSTHHTIPTRQDLRSHLISQKIGFIVVTHVYGPPEMLWFRDAVKDLATANPQAVRIAKQFDDPACIIYAVDYTRL